MPKIKTYQGKILIAMPRVKSRIFQHTVIYIHTDDSSGTLGMITNHQVDSVQAKEWAETVGWDWPDRIFYGGPVDAHLGYVVHSPDYMRETTQSISRDISFTSGKSILDDISRGTGPLDFALIVGYCSWQPGQLQNEIERGDWFVSEYDAGFFYNQINKDAAWEEAVNIAGELEAKRMLKVVDID